ncbi:hypothetical protein HYS91_05190 [Candidatus Daviesbacteria bacterium]|nr:hypothetical protein [Candidatus Daviesbacteria bacterium]
MTAFQKLLVAILFFPIQILVIAAVAPVMFFLAILVTISTFNLKTGIHTGLSLWDLVIEQKSEQKFYKKITLIYIIFFLVILIFFWLT